MVYGFALDYQELRRTRQLLGLVLTDEPVSEVKENAEVQENSFQQKLSYAGFAEKVHFHKFLTKFILSSFLIALVVSFIFVWSLPFVILLSALFFYSKLNKLAIKRAQDFEKDYTALLLSLASGVRTGADPLIAFTNCAGLFDKESLVALEIEKLKVSIESGVPEEKAVLNFAADIRHPDLQLFRAAFILSRQEGSSLASCLQRLAKVTRQRQSFRRQIRSAVAMQRLSAIGIGVCACAIGLIQFSSNPDAMIQTIHHPIGSKAIIAGVALIVTGIVWMLRLSRNKV